MPPYVNETLQELEPAGQAVAALIKGVKDATGGVPIVQNIFTAIDFLISSVRQFQSNREEWKNLAGFLLRLCRGLEGDRFGRWTRSG